MSLSPLIRVGEVLVILDGRDRLSWRPDRTSGWMPAALWPDRSAAHDVRRRLAERRPTLIVLSGPTEAVPLLDEQLVGMAPSLTPLVRDVPNDLPALCINALDWLPDELRRRGLAFVEANRARVVAIPEPLRAPLTLEGVDSLAPHVRFAHRLGPCPHLRRDLPAIAAHAFPALQDGIAA